MIKSKKNWLFFQEENLWWKWKKISISTKLVKLHENPRIEENEKQLYKAPRVTYNEFENSLERDSGKRP